MLGLVLATLWRRRGQTARLTLLALIAASGAAMAPAYVLASLHALTAALVADAAPTERVVEATIDSDIGADLSTDLGRFADRVTGELGLANVSHVTGASMVAVIDSQLYSLAYREDMCAHLAIDGACPQRPLDVLLPGPLADRLHVRVGEKVAVRGRNEVPPVSMTVVGRYRALDPLDPYWGRTSQAASGDRLADVGIFTSPGTFTALRPNRAELTVALITTTDTYRDADPAEVAAEAEEGALRLRADDIRVASGLRAMADRFAHEQRIVVNGVVVGVSLLLVVSWLSLILAARRTAEVRRSDIGLLKLRGLRRRDLWRLSIAQTAVPLAIGGALGLALGPYLASRLAGPVPNAQAQAWRLAAAGAAVAVLGAVVAALVAESRELSESVAGLSRRVGVRRSRRWVAIVDAAVVGVAVAGAYQVSAAGEEGGVALLAPLLLALAVGVIAARLVPWAASRVGARAVRSGRVGAGLAAMHLARRPGTGSVLGVAVVVLAELVVTLLAWSAASAAQEQRAVLEVGAPRVLTVRAASIGQLIAAARAADPASMAVVRTNGAAASVLAVDATRLGAVVPTLAAYDLPQWTTLATTLHPAGYEPMPVRASTVTLDATYQAAPVESDARLVARIANGYGESSTLSFGPLLPGRHTYRPDRDACTSDCRLVALTLTGGGEVIVHRIEGAAEPIVLADRTRWRADVTGDVRVPQITATPDGLRLAAAADDPSEPSDATAFVADTPTPLPVVRAGDVTLDRIEPQAAVLGSDPVPVRVTAVGRAIPMLHSGLMTDLEYAYHLSAPPRGATLQVWLAAAVPADAERNLEAAGVEVIGSETIADRRAELEARGPQTAARFVLLIVVDAVLLALLSFGVTALAERRVRADELAALRRQGMRVGTLRRAAYGGYLVLAAIAVSIGTATGLALARLMPIATAASAGGSFDLPAPAPSAGLPIAITATVAAAFATIAVLAGFGLVRATRRLARGVPWSG